MKHKRVPQIQLFTIVHHQPTPRHPSRSIFVAGRASAHTYPLSRTTRDARCIASRSLSMRAIAGDDGLLCGTGAVAAAPPHTCASALILRPLSDSIGTAAAANVTGESGDCDRLD